MAKLFLTLLFVFGALFLVTYKTNKELPIPSPTPIANYVQPELRHGSEAYTIIFVGDSMVAALGENFDELRIDLKEYYPETVFGLFNYGFGATNILSAYSRLSEESFYNGKQFQSITGREFDVIVIGSFGHNPLSEYPLEEGLAKQTQELDKIVLELATKKPNSLIVFLAEIAPSLEKYAEGQVDLSPEKRREWALERRAYIENHMNYAKSHRIPLIDAYSSDLKYVSTTDYIHPSSEGVSFMSQQIANFLASVI